MYKNFASTTSKAPARNLSARYIVNVAVNPADGGYVSRSLNKAVYEAGDPLTLTAVANNGYTFTGWSGSSTSANATLSGPVDSDLDLTANFLPTYKLTINISHQGRGYARRDPVKDAYTANEQVTVTATPASGYRFTGWSGAASGTANPATIIMKGDKTLTANFQTAYTLTTMPSPPAGGVVTRYPDKEAYTSGERVIVTAEPAEGYTFTGWTGAVTSRNTTVTVTMNRNKTLTPNFYLKTIPPPAAPKPEPAAKEPSSADIIIRPKPVFTFNTLLQEIARIKYSVGGGIFYAGDFGGGVQWTDGGVLAMPYNVGGAYLFVDAGYAALSVGYSQGGGMWESTNNINPNDLPYMHRSQLNIGLFAKYPNLIKAAIFIVDFERSMSIYPILGLDYDSPTFGKLDFGNGNREYVFDGTNKDGYDAGALSALWVKFGGGFEVNVTPKTYACVELLYGARMSNWFEIDQMYNKNQVNMPMLGHGLTLKAGVGFKL